MGKHAPSLAAKIVRKSNAVFNDKFKSWKRDKIRGNARQQFVYMGEEDFQTCGPKTVRSLNGGSHVIPAKTIKRPIYKLILHKAA